VGFRSSGTFPISEPGQTALHLFQAIADANTEQQYTDLHDELHVTTPAPASVIPYFESNWHPIGQWVMYWQ